MQSQKPSCLGMETERWNGQSALCDAAPCSNTSATALAPLSSNALALLAMTTPFHTGKYRPQPTAGTAPAHCAPQITPLP